MKALPHPRDELRRVPNPRRCRILGDPRACFIKKGHDFWISGSPVRGIGTENFQSILCLSVDMWMRAMVMVKRTKAAEKVRAQFLACSAFSGSEPKGCRIYSNPLRVRL